MRERIEKGRTNGEKDREREPGETKVGQWPGHVEKNGAQRAGRRHTVLLIHRPLLAAPGSVCPFRKRFAIPSWKWDATSSRYSSRRREGNLRWKSQIRIARRAQWERQLIMSRQGCAVHQPRYSLLRSHFYWHLWFLKKYRSITTPANWIIK